MPSRLALVNCRIASEGPWTLAKGNESKVEIFGLSQGEWLMLELETLQGQATFEYFSIGIHPWPSLDVVRYRLCKKAEDVVSPAPTTVRILLNGKTKTCL